MSYWNELLIISHCKCGIELGNDCSCEDEKKIPSHARIFYVDQCFSRMRSLGDIESDSDDDDDEEMDVDVDVGGHSDESILEVCDSDDDPEQESQEPQEKQEPQAGPSSAMFPETPTARRLPTSSSIESHFSQSASEISTASAGYQPGESDFEEFNISQRQVAGD